MHYCKNCKMDIRGNRKYCPLCQGILEGEGSAEAFPFIPVTERAHPLLLKILLFCSLTAAAICVTINMIIPTRIWWSIFVLAGIGSLWISLSVAIKKRRNIAKNIVWQVILISVLTVAWDFFTDWHGWSIDYVIPIICVCAMIAIAFMIKIQKFGVSEYLIYLIIDSLFGITPLVFIFCNWVTIQYPSMICVFVSITSLIALLCFKGEQMKNEIKRRLHL